MHHVMRIYEVSHCLQNCLPFELLSASTLLPIRALCQPQMVLLLQESQLQNISTLLLNYEGVY